ncbi:molecular chaperone [Pseudomonas rubra]|uniref:Molecular chaperone n=1 Tax=Pseudomonas rubra TaxID=2942627 RepID=A0ABT5P9J9_9PSED|nr:molecular chaperone [Pseudomonas rubra]MDD1014982.1 molecular chaperone [Pseudomonas rubra]MDD1038103.1 molecular chaperone [Pseudomonas rubra]MDD1156616.1 molecular chaperone [Pseudomonas rubra]
MHRFFRYELGLRLCLAGVLAMLPVMSAQAGIILSNTRVVFDANKRDVSVTAGNATDKPYAVQVWVNTEADDNVIAAPFIATPPLFRLDSMKEQMVRIVPTANDLPSDRESVFYFNAQEIPAANSEEDGTLKIALRTRIKLFYRPKGLEGSLLEALPGLQWVLRRDQGKALLEVHNPSPFHISFIHIKVAAGERESEIDKPVMVAPRSRRVYEIEPGLNWTPQSVVFSVINDHGGFTDPEQVSLSDAR